VSDLKDVQTARDKRNQSDLHSTQVKKDARKELRRLGADEIAKDVARDQKQKMEAAAQAEAQALTLAGKQVSDQGALRYLCICAPHSLPPSSLLLLQWRT
jgi:hypothetical protein